jgi:hypothetical protein
VRQVQFSCFAPGLIFDGTEGVGSCFLVLRPQTRFRRFRGRRVPFSCFARPDSFSAVPSGSGPVFMFCAPELVVGGTVGVGSRFPFLRTWTFFSGVECVGYHFPVLRGRTRFLRYRGRRVPFSCFARPHSFSAVPRSSGPVFMFCAPGYVFGGNEGVESRFHVLHARTHFSWQRGRQVPFSCFARPDSFLAVPRASATVFIFCAPELVFSGVECVGSLFHVLRTQTHFRRYRGRRDPFSCFALQNSFSAGPRASVTVFMFCAPELVFRGTEGVGSRFHVLLSWTRFRRYRGRGVPFSCFALPDSISAVSSASGPVFMFCALGLVFVGIEGVGFLFLV